MIAVTLGHATEPDVESWERRHVGRLVDRGDDTRSPGITGKMQGLRFGATSTPSADCVKVPL